MPSASKKRFSLQSLSRWIRSEIKRLSGRLSSLIFVRRKAAGSATTTLEFFVYQSAFPAWGKQFAPGALLRIILSWIMNRGIGMVQIRAIQFRGRREGWLVVRCGGPDSITAKHTARGKQDDRITTAQKRAILRGPAGDSRVRDDISTR